MDLSKFNYTEAEETELVRKQFAECHKIFRAECFDEDDPVPCQIHDAFGDFGEHHNCLGCNFADMVHLIEGYLQSHATFKCLDHTYITYILLCYLLVERMDTLFNLIDLNDAYRKENFKILLMIRRWANFIKHPKAFLLTHHAEYSYAGSPKNLELEKNSSVKIDRTFVDKYYSNDEKNNDLYKELENREKVLVVFPEATYVTKELCEAMKRCVAVITENAVYRDILKKRTTFLDYWKDIPAPTGA